jgi:hypothetical protein
MSTARLEVGRLPADRAGWLGFATFALMACLSAIGAPGAAICSATAFLLPINDMALMYLLMSIFHLSPWIRLWSARSPRCSSPVTRTEGD